MEEEEGEDDADRLLGEDDQDEADTWVAAQCRRACGWRNGPNKLCSSQVGLDLMVRHL